MKFSKPIPYNPGDKTLGPVSMKTWFYIQGEDKRIKLNNATAELVPGSGWGNLVTITTSFVQDQTTFQIDAVLSPPPTIKVYESLILGKKSIPIKSTLSPEASLPGMGIPIPIGGAPVRDQIDLIIPGLPPPELETKAEYAGEDGSGKPQAYVMATINFPLKIEDITSAVNTININVTDGGSAVTEGPESTEGVFKKKLITGLADQDVMKQARVIVTVSALVFGIRLEQTLQLTFESAFKYFLNIKPKTTLHVTPETAVSFSAEVFSLDQEGNRLQAKDALISLDVPSDTTQFMTVSPVSGTGVLNATISQINKTDRKEVPLSLHASVMNNEIPDNPSIIVVFGEPLAGPLQTEFKDGKNSISPFLQKDQAVLKVRLTSTNNQPIAAKFTFEKANPAGWLDDPSVQWDFGEGWTAVTLEATSPDPDYNGDPPTSEDVQVTATKDDTVIAKQNIPIFLLPRSRIEVSPTEICLLGSKAERSGIVSPKKSEEVRVSVQKSGPEQWEYIVEADADSAKLVTVSGPRADESGAVFTISVIDGLKPNEPPIGPDAWRRYATLHTKAKSGPVIIDGPDVHVTIFFEGLFIKGIYHREKGYWKSSGKEDHVTLRSDLPMDNPDRTSRVKFVAMAWNGTEVQEDTSQVDAAHLRFSEPVSDDKDATTILSFRDFLVEFREDHYDVDNAWDFSLGRFIPGNGSILKLSIDAENDFGTISLPVEINTGKPGRTIGTLTEEQTNLFRFIKDVIPSERPEYNRFIHDLAEFGKKHAGAEDYYSLRTVVWEEAQRIWQEDQQDYLVWAPWEGTVLNTLSIAKTVGDFSFSIVVGYYTRSMSFGTSFAAQQLSSLVKDELISFFNYYVDQYEKGNDNIKKVSIKYATENCLRILEGIAVGGLETFILKNFDPKNPNVKILLAFFIWKFGYHKFRQKPNGEYSSYGEAIKATIWDMGNFAFMVLFQEFVNVNGNKTLTDIYNKVKSGTPAGTPPKPGDEPKTNGEKTTDGKGGQTPKSTRAAVKKVETMQKGAPDKECLVIHDADGNEVASNVGNSDSTVAYPPGINYKGLKATHSHPTTANGEEGGAHSSGDINDAVNLGLSESTVSGKDKIYVLEVNNKAIDSGPEGGQRGELANQMGNVHEALLKTTKKKADGKIEETLKDMEAKTGEPPTKEDIKRVQNDAYLEAKQKACERLAELYPQYITFTAYPK